MDWGIWNELGGQLYAALFAAAVAFLDAVFAEPVAAWFVALFSELLGT